MFYVGSLLLLSLLLPYTAYEAGVSPFVTFFGSIGWTGVDAIMNMIVLTAALSSLNAGLYSTGRILHSMSKAGSAPKFAGRMNKAGVPCGGIALTARGRADRRRAERRVPSAAFEIVLNLSCLGILASWATIVACQLRLFSWSRKGLLQRPSFRMFGAPYTGYLVLAFLVGVLVLMAFDYPVGHLHPQLGGRDRPAAGRRMVRLAQGHRTDRRGAGRRLGRLVDGKYRRDERPTGATRLGDDRTGGVEAYDRRRRSERTWAVVQTVRGIGRIAGRPGAGRVGPAGGAARRSRR